MWSFGRGEMGMGGGVSISDNTPGSTGKDEGEKEGESDDVRGEDEDELVSNDIDDRWRRPPGGRGGSAGPKSTGKREHQKTTGKRYVIGGKFKRIYNIPRDVYIMTASWIMGE